MKLSIAGFCFLIITVMTACSTQNKIASSSNSSGSEQEIISLSKDKWRWMADKNTDSLDVLFDDKSMFVHMGGSWGKTQEIDVIKKGTIHYKKAEVYSVIVNMMEIQQYC